MKKIFVCFLIFSSIIFLRCDWLCRHDHIFEFVYPNVESKMDFTFDVDYSEVPVDEYCVYLTYDISITNCGNNKDLVIEIYTKFASENEYYLWETLELLPQEAKDSSHYYLGSPDCFKERYISILIKGINSDCFYGNINIKTGFILGGLGKAKCPYGYEVD